jgi:hypothetical protein
MGKYEIQEALQEQGGGPRRHFEELHQKSSRGSEIKHEIEAHSPDSMVDQGEEVE